MLQGAGKKRGVATSETWYFLPSMVSLLWQSAFSGAVIFGLFQTTLPEWSVLLLADLILLQLVYAARSMRAGSAVAAVTLLPDGDWQIQLRDGRRLACAFSGATVTPHAAVLALRPAERRFPVRVVVWPDSLGKEAFRRLRVAVKWRCGSWPA